jgi:hypothetical protein
MDSQLPSDVDQYLHETEEKVLTLVGAADEAAQRLIDEAIDRNDGIDPGEFDLDTGGVRFAKEAALQLIRQANTAATQSIYDLYADVNLMRASSAHGFMATLDDVFDRVLALLKGRTDDSQRRSLKEKWCKIASDRSAAGWFVLRPEDAFVMPASIAEPTVWRDLEERFRELGRESGDHSRASWTSSAWNELGEQWSLMGMNSRERVMFEALAERGAVGLGYKKAQGTLFLWLNRLKNEGINFRLRGQGTDGTVISQHGALERPCEASAVYCFKLETRAHREQETPSIGSGDKDSIQPNPGAKAPATSDQPASSALPPAEVKSERSKRAPLPLAAPPASSAEHQVAVQTTTVNVADKVQAEVAPENLPLPQLPEALAHEVDVAKAEALVKLHDELNAIWTACFRVQDEQRFRTPAPDQFFPPFVSYGVAMYVARAEALLKLHPEPLLYQDWLNFGLKTLICDELAPCRSVENSGIPAYEVPLSAWQVHMGITWRHFDHPQHSAFFSKARRLIDALEDPIDGHWGRFISFLHNGMSRKTLSLLTKALKLLGGPNDSEPEAVVKPEAGTSGAPSASPPPEAHPEGQREASQSVIIKGRKRGPTADYDTAIRVAGIVALLAGDSPWRSKLDDICFEFDEKHIPPPKTWKKRGHGDWCDCLAAERELVVKAIEHHLELAGRRTETFS